jgi:hypothetical protein
MGRRFVFKFLQKKKDIKQISTIKSNKKNGYDLFSK